MTERDHSTAGRFTLDRDTKLVVDACSAKCWCEPETFSQRDAPLMQVGKSRCERACSKRKLGPPRRVGAQLLNSSTSLEITGLS